MATSFQYDSREHHQPLNRTKRFYAFLVVLVCLIVAITLLLFYGEDWSSDQQIPSFLRGLIIGLLIGLALFIITALISKKNKSGYDHYQTLSVSDQKIEWLLNKKDGPQSVTISDLEYATLDQRHLMLKLHDGTELWIENYTLIDRETHWDPFVQAVKERVPVRE